MAPSTTWDSSFQERLTTNLVASSICPVQLGLPEILASIVRSRLDVAWCRPSFCGGGEKMGTPGSVFPTPRAAATSGGGMPRYCFPPMEGLWALRALATTLLDVICTACGKRGADVRPNFNWDAKGPIGGMGIGCSRCPAGKPNPKFPSPRRVPVSIIPVWGGSREWQPWCRTSSPDLS